VHGLVQRRLQSEQQLHLVNWRERLGELREQRVQRHRRQERQRLVRLVVDLSRDLHRQLFGELLQLDL